MNIHKYPEFYHQNHNQKNYFEGWYYKQVSKDKSHTISIIPGVSFNGINNHSFIQVIYYNKEVGLMSKKIDFDIDFFTCKNDDFQVKIANNKFCLSGIELAINDDEISIIGKLEFSKITRVKRNILNPNIMGFFSYLPHMECNHGVISMSHYLQGSLTINGQEIDFTKGKGYLEKDWGRSFPKNYLWLQSNDFDNYSVSFFCSLATIPLKFINFEGLICNLQINGIEYRFATYNHSKATVVKITDKYLEINLKNFKYQLNIRARIDNFKSLKAPKKGAMSHTIKEGLSGEVELRLKNKSNKIIYHGTGNQSGIELEFM